MEMFVLPLLGGFLGALVGGLVIRLADRWAEARKDRARRLDRRQEVLERRSELISGPPFRT